MGWLPFLPSPEKEPFLYVSVDEMKGATLEVDTSLARNLIQQELLQILLSANDIDIDIGKTPVSIIEERRVPDVPEDEDDADPKYRAARAALNVPNMCLYDVMLLMTLYADDEEVVSQAKLGLYLEYLRKNRRSIEEKARRVQNDPKYSDVFAVKC